MRSVTVIILHAFVAQAITKEDSLDKIADTMVNKLVEKLKNTDLDKTTLGKPAALGYGTPTIMRAPQALVPPAVSIAQDKLRANGINVGPLETLALTAIDANNRGIGMRNVAVMATNLPSEQRAALSQLQKEVVVKAEAYLGLGEVQGEKKEDMAGITAPFGFFDPVGWSADIDGKRLAFYREAELKHGRLGMLASLGFFAGETFSPLLGATDTTTPATKLFGQALPAVPAQFWGAVVVAASFAELILHNTQKVEGLAPGDFGWDPLGMKPKDAKGLLEMQNKELNNGRLAMLAAAGIIAQELVTGEKIFR